MFKNRENRKPNFIGLGVIAGLALGVIASMIIGATTDDGSFLPIGIGAGMAVGAGVGAILKGVGKVDDETAVAKKTNTIWWSIVAYTVHGIIMVA